MTKASKPIHPDLLTPTVPAPEPAILQQHALPALLLTLLALVRTRPGAAFTLATTRPARTAPDATATTYAGRVIGVSGSGAW